MLSDNDTLVLKVFLSRVGLLDYFSDIIPRNLTLEENGQLVFEDIPKTTCPLGGQFLCKGGVLMDYIKDKNYETVSYFGDGKNGFCPTTKLSQNDRVSPRKNFPLDLKLQEYEVQAKVQSWKTGIDLLKVL
jgi:hypothetical protein